MDITNTTATTTPTTPEFSSYRDASAYKAANDLSGTIKSLTVSGGPPRFAIIQPRGKAG